MSWEDDAAPGVLYDDVIEIIRQMHPNVSVIAAIDDASLSTIQKQLDGIYDLDILSQINIDSTEHPYSGTAISAVTAAEHTLTQDRNNVCLYTNLKTGGSDAGYIYYRINSGSWVLFGTETGTSYVTKSVSIGNCSNGDFIEFGIASAAGGSNTYADELEIKATTSPVTSGNVLTDALAANTAVLSFFSHMKGKFSNGASSHALPVGVEIFGNGDSYAAALNATTKFKIDPSDPRIELYRVDDSVVAKSNAQTNWLLDDNATNGAFAAKTTSTHETILAEEIGCASVVMVEKSVNGAFTDTEIMVEDDDYTVDYSTRTATKIIITSAEAADIVISQSKIRITWIADVEDIDGTANTALKMKIYLNRTATTEASPEIQKIDLGTDKYAEMKYTCG